MAEVEQKSIQRIPIRDPKRKIRQFSPKLIELTKWERIEELNEMLDTGMSPNFVADWVKKHGYSISAPMVYEYAELRKRSLSEGITMDRLLGSVRNPIWNTDLELKKTLREKLQSELDALDLVIQRGYENLKNNEEKISAGTMMAAIKLKNDLTEGTHGFLTNYGIQRLREVEMSKYALIVKHLLSYIPKEDRNRALVEMAELEENYYYNTDYYEEYLRASNNLTEEQIQIKLDKWKHDIIIETTEVMEKSPRL